MNPSLIPPANRPIDQGDWNLAFLFPHEVVEARQRAGLILLPVAPVEWHGPHLAMGCDPLLAHHFARLLAQELRCPYYPPVFLGTERDRRPQVLEALGFEPDEYVEGMDFPANPVSSCYLREETFALVLRDLIGLLLNRLRFPHVLIVNGHGADNQRTVLDRLCREFNATEERVRWVYPGFPHSLVAGSIGHADAAESSMLAAAWPGSVDLSRLPAEGALPNTAFAVIDGDTFDGKPTPDHTLRSEQDPRWHTDAAWGQAQIEQAAGEVLAEVRAWCGL